LGVRLSGCPDWVRRGLRPVNVAFALLILIKVNYTTIIENSLNIAEETNTIDIIVTKDFNFNSSKPTLPRKLILHCRLEQN
jgi:hypothetical protein